MSVKRRYLVPETLQTSGMDCGPAALKSLLAGLSISASYERLRDACRTGADGTSIDALEDLSLALGLEASQEIAPIADAVEVLEARAPCIVVVKGSSGGPHFVVFWRVVAGFVQLMDPARGRVWIPKRTFTRELHVHTQGFDDASFREWFDTTEWKAVLERRLERLGATAEATQGTQRGSAGPLSALPAHELGARDAAARLVERLVAKGALPRSSARSVVEKLSALEVAEDAPVIPEELSAVSREGESIHVRGVVFLALRPGDASARAPGAAAPALAKALENVLGADGPSAYDVLKSQLSVHGRRVVVLLAFLAAFIALLAFGEMLLLRAAFNADMLLSLPQQRFAGVLMYGGLLVMMLVLEATLGFGVVRFGRALELRTRIALLAKLPRLPDRYFRTRPMSDVTHRSQGLFQVKPLPELLISLVKLSLDVVVTVVALCVLYPRGIPYSLAALGFGLLAPFVTLRARREVEQRVQAHSSSLGQLYLDVLLGLVPLRSHGGQHAIRRKQDEHLVDWRRESERSIGFLSAIEAVQSIGILVTITLLLWSYLRVEQNQGTLLLISFWALRLPLEARALSAGLQRVPGVLAATGRLVEPLTAHESPADVEVGDEETLVLGNRPGMSLRFRDVGVVLGTHEVLAGFSLDIKGGAHIAIVGSSGAGKSSLLAVLLGLLERAQGEILVDGHPVERYDVGRLRRETVWVDPAVQLWNRSMLANLQFGNPLGARHPLDAIVEETELKDLLERMSKGFATPLGESGARVSGGEGQRVRLSRALLRRGARLVLLDEAFRGLDRRARRRFSKSVRARAKNVTLLEVTHDVADTQEFDRILVIEDGKLVEDGPPRALLATAGSRYAELVRADLDVQAAVWSASHWKRIILEAGSVRTIEAPAHAGATSSSAEAAPSTSESRPGERGAQ